MGLWDRLTGRARKHSSDSASTSSAPSAEGNDAPDSEEGDHPTAPEPASTREPVALPAAVTELFATAGRELTPLADVPGLGTIWLTPVESGEAENLWREFDAVDGISVVILADGTEQTDEYFGVLGTDRDLAAHRRLIQDAESIDPAAVFDLLQQKVTADLAPGDPGDLLREPGTVSPGPGSLAIFPDPRQWLIPAWLDYLGPVNLGIEPSELAAVLRRWEQRWQARLMIVGEAEWALEVASPPTDDATALEVAREHCLVAPDAVEPNGLWGWVPVVRSHRWAHWWD